jgi:hypothetical protein
VLLALPGFVVPIAPLAAALFTLEHAARNSALTVTAPALNWLLHHMLLLLLLPHPLLLLVLPSC